MINTSNVSQGNNSTFNVSQGNNCYTAHFFPWCMASVGYNIIYRVMIQCQIELNIKHTLMVEPCSISWQYIMKHLKYVTKDYIAMHTILFKLKMALFFSSLVV